MPLKVHSRQFIFARSARVDMPGWRQIVLPEGWTLHHEPGAAVQRIGGDPAAPVIRIGHALNLDEANGGEDRSGRSGSGRFALLDWPHLSADTAALMGLIYGERDGAQVVSSSARLAAEVLAGRPVEPDFAEALHPRHPINYIPSPGTRFSGIRRLIHDQSLDLAAFAVRHRPSTIRPLASYGAALDTLVGELCRFAEELKARVPGTVFLPLTAGLDSRLLAAAFTAAGLPFEAVTLDYRGKPSSDVTVARKISRRLGVRHRAIRLFPCNPDLAEVFLHHTGAAFTGWDNTDVFPGGGYRYLGPDDAMIVGACFEVGRQTAGGTCFKGLDFATATGAAIWSKRNKLPAPAALAAFLDEWIAWRRDHPLEMDFAATFYLDQRLGAWRASLEQGYDLLPGVSLCPANNPRIYSALITPGLAEQIEGRLQRDAIGRLVPDLLGFPLNPKTLRCHMKHLRRGIRGTVLPKLAGLLHPKPAVPPGE